MQKIQRHFIEVLTNHTTAPELYAFTYAEKKAERMCPNCASFWEGE